MRRPGGRTTASCLSCVPSAGGQPEVILRGFLEHWPDGLSSHVRRPPRASVICCRFEEISTHPRSIECRPIRSSCCRLSAPANTATLSTIHPDPAESHPVGALAI